VDISFSKLKVAFLLSILAASAYCSHADLAYGAEKNHNAQDIVTKADDIRFPRDDFEVNVTITSTHNEQKDLHKYQILSKGRDKTIVLTTYPPSERGQILLMKERDLWAYMPNVSQPIRLSLAQRLTGEVANGDLTRANFSGDYHATLIKTETIGGQVYQVLDLSAVDRSVTYHRVVYWVNQTNFRPYKAEFYSSSGRVMKICHYTGYRKLGNKLRPTRLIMEDALRKGQKSVLEYSDLQVRQIPDKVFTKDYLKKLQ